MKIAISSAEKKKHQQKNHPKHESFAMFTGVIITLTLLKNILMDYPIKIVAISMYFNCPFVPPYKYQNEKALLSRIPESFILRHSHALTCYTIKLKKFAVVLPQGGP